MLVIHLLILDGILFLLREVFIFHIWLGGDTSQNEDHKFIKI